MCIFTRSFPKIRLFLTLWFCFCSFCLTFFIFYSNHSSQFQFLYPTSFSFLILDLLPLVSSVSSLCSEVGYMEFKCQKHFLGDWELLQRYQGKMMKPILWLSQGRGLFPPYMASPGKHFFMDGIFFLKTGNHSEMFKLNTYINDHVKLKLHATK